MGEFLEALQAAAESLAAAEAVLDALGRLKLIRARVDAVPRLRPWVPVLQAVDRVLEYCDQVAYHYLIAFGARLPLDGQRAAEKGQEAIDSAAAAVEPVSNLLDRWGRIASTETVEGAVAALFVELYADADAEDLLSLDRSGHHLYEKVAGLDDCPPGLGFCLRAASVQVESVSDAEQFWKVVTEAFQRLTKDPLKLQAVLRSRDWETDLLDAMDRAYGATVACQALLTAAKRSQDEVRALLTLALDLVEGWGKQFVTTLLTIDSGKSYANLRSKDAGALLTICNQRELGHLIIGLDKTLRVARAHEEYRLLGERITLGGKKLREQTLTVDELVDRVLAGAESALALEVATRCAAASVGIAIADVHLTRDLGLDPADAVILTLAMAGWSDISVHVDTLTVKAQGHWASAPEGFVKVLGALLAHLPDEHAEVELIAEFEGKLTRCEALLDPFRRHAACEAELERELWFAEGCFRCHVDGRPVFSADHLRKLVAVRATQAMGQPMAGSIPDLRALIRFAQRVGDPPLEKGVRAYVGFLRSRELGLPSDREDERNLKRIHGWLTETLSTAFE